MGSHPLQRVTLGRLIEIVVAATPSEKNVFGKPMGDLIHVEASPREILSISRFVLIAVIFPWVLNWNWKISIEMVTTLETALDWRRRYMSGSGKGNNYFWLFIHICLLLHISEKKIISETRKGSGFSLRRKETPVICLNNLTLEKMKGNLQSTFVCNLQVIKEHFTWLASSSLISNTSDDTW